jgi:hypothetical protein
MQNQNFAITLIEDADDPKPTISVDTETCAPQVIIRYGMLTIQFPPERAAELAATINAAVTP